MLKRLTLGVVVGFEVQGSASLPLFLLASRRARLAVSRGSSGVTNSPQENLRIAWPSFVVKSSKRCNVESVCIRSLANPCQEANVNNKS